MLLWISINFCVLEAAFIQEDRLVLLFDKGTFTYCNNPGFITINDVGVAGTNMIFQFDYNGLGTKYTMISLPEKLKDPERAVVKYTAPASDASKAWNYTDGKWVESFEFTGSFVKELTPEKLALIDQTVAAANAQRTVPSKFAVSNQYRVAYWTCWRYYKDCSHGSMNFNNFLERFFRLSITDGKGAAGDKGQTPQNYVSTKMNHADFKTKEFGVQFATLYDDTLYFSAFNTYLDFAMTVFDSQRNPQKDILFKEIGIKKWCKDFYCEFFR